MNQIAIVGGGISGLSAAYFLSKAGCSCTLIERSPLLGGLIRTEHVDGCMIEAGPDSFIAQKPWAMELIRELGIEDQVIGSNDSVRQTFICRDGRLVPLPDGIQFLAPTKLLPILTTPLFSWRAKASIVSEWFHRAPHQQTDRSVADFVTEHYGQEVNEYLAQPMLVGVYGGSAEKLSVQSVLPRFVEIEREHGSLTRGILHSRKAVGRDRPAGPNAPTSLFLSLKAGMQQLTDTLASQLEGKVRRITGTVRALEIEGGGFRLRMDEQSMSAGQIVLAVPAYRAGKLLQGLDHGVSELLCGIPYSSSMTAALLYDRTGWRHPLNGFGFLVPRAERRPLAACTWVNTKFPLRVAENRVLLRGFLAGRQAEAELPSSDEQVAQLVHQQCGELMRFEQDPDRWAVHRWQKAMAQYEVGHQRRVAELEARCDRFPGLHLTGNAYTGIGIPDCIRRSRLIAERVVKAAEAVELRERGS